MSTHLEEQHKWHPLIVAMIALLLAIFVAQSRPCHIGANLSMLLAGYREGVRYPAEGVDHMHGYRSIVNAANRITCKGKERMSQDINGDIDCISKLGLRY